MIPLPTPQWSQVQRTRPPESDERRADMPKPVAGRTASLDKEAVDTISAQIAANTPPTLTDAETGRVFLDDPEDPESTIEATAGGLIQGPRHLGLRRYSGLSRDRSMGKATADDLEAQARAEARASRKEAGR